MCLANCELKQPLESCEAALVLSQKARPIPIQLIAPNGESNGVKRSLLTDGAGIPLALAVDGANRHDRKLLVCHS